MVYTTLVSKNSKGSSVEMESNYQDVTSIEGSIDDLSPLMSSVVLRNKKNNKDIQRSKKCFSVVVEPSAACIVSKKENFRQSMYELGTSGWILGKLNNNSPLKNNLNLDKEIDTILNVSSSADVVLGNIKLTF